jgi:TonB family protein
VGQTIAFVAGHGGVPAVFPAQLTISGFLPILTSMKTLCGFRIARFLGAMTLAALLSVPGHTQDEPKKISKTEGLNAVKTKVAPEYPAVAKQLKIEGAVELEALVTESGTVDKVNIISGNPILTRPASDAVKKWKFAPFTSDGKAVKALVPVSMSFKM